jgi:voltage-gated potassium channel
MNIFDNQFLHKLRLAIFLIFAVQVGGIVGFMAIEGYSFAESFYMTVIIVSTVGLGAVHDLSPEGRIFVAVLIIVSLGIATYAISVITTYLLEGGLQQYYKHKKVKSRIEKLNGHIIVCGYGRNGKQACEQLRLHKRQFVVIESNSETTAHFNNDPSMLFIEGDATRDEVLHDAGIERASALITSLPKDADNVFVVLTARGLNSSLKIISRASEDSSFSKIKRAGADNVIMPDKIGGVHMASLIAQPDVLEFVDVITGKAAFDLEEISFKNCKSQFLNQTLGSLNLPVNFGINILGMKSPDGGYVINPPDQTIISCDMKLFVLGTNEQVERLKQTVSA